MIKAVNNVQSFLLSIIIILCVVSFPTLSNENEPYLNNTHKQHYLTLVTEHLPPFQYIENGEIKGFATDIIKKALHEFPYEHEIILYPWSRAYNLALNKPNTCIYSIARTEERENKFIWIDNFAERNVSFVGLSTNKKIQINSIEDAKKYRIAVIRDDVNHQLLLSHGFTETQNLFIVNNSYSMLKLLKQRADIDLIIADPFTINYRAKINLINPADFKSFFQVNSQPLDYYLACHLDTSPEIIQYLLATFKKLKKSGDMAAIQQKWQFHY